MAPPGTAAAGLFFGRSRAHAPAMVHAIRVHEAGGPEVLQWEEVEVGEPGPGQVRLRQTAVGLNYIDVYHRTGLYPQPLPFTPGTEGAGVVEAVGEGVDGPAAPGDRVAYAGPIGGYAEARLIDADRLVKLPDEISDELAAAMMLQGMTARMLLRGGPRGAARRHDPGPCRRGRGRPDPLPMGQRARRNSDRHGRRPTRRPSSPGPTAATIRSSTPGRISSPKSSASPAAQSCRSSTIPSGATRSSSRSTACAPRGLMVSYRQCVGPARSDSRRDCSRRRGRCS